MNLEGEYAPSPCDWVREQVEAYEGSGGPAANTLRDTGLPIIIVTNRGNKSGAHPQDAADAGRARRRVRAGGLAGRRTEAPGLVLQPHGRPDAVTIQDGPEPFDADVRQVTGDERAEWWERAVAAYPPYAEYQAKTERQIPVFVTSRRT